MKGLWIPYNMLSVNKVLVGAKTLINFMKFVIQFVITLMRRKRKSIFVGTINLLWLKRIQKLLCKKHALETNFWKILTTKINYSITNRNYCVSLFGKEKKKYFTILNEKDITDNRKFWHTPFFHKQKFKLSPRKSLIC